jgi:hypothetical protein
MRKIIWLFRTYRRKCTFYFRIGKLNSGSPWRPIRAKTGRNCFGLSDAEYRLNSHGNSWRTDYYSFGGRNMDKYASGKGSTITKISYEAAIHKRARLWIFIFDRNSIIRAKRTVQTSKEMYMRILLAWANSGQPPG